MEEKVPINYIRGLAASIQTLLRYLVRPIWLTPSTGRLRVEPEAGTITTVTTVTTVTTCATVTSLAQLAGFSARDVHTFTLDRINWGENVRRRIT